MGIKDNICTWGVKTTCASKILGDFRPAYDATVMEKLHQAGGVMVGKLNMDEFAMGSTSETSFYGATKNPWDLTRCPAVPPAGLLPQLPPGVLVRHRFRHRRFHPSARSLLWCHRHEAHLRHRVPVWPDCLRILSGSDGAGGQERGDCAAVLDTIMGKDPHDGTSLNITGGGLLDGLTGDLKGMKVGIPADCFGSGLDPEVRESVLGVAEVLRGRGAQVEEFQLPIMEYVVPTYYILASAEASSNLSRFDGVKYGWRAEDYTDLTDLYNKTRTQGFGSEVKRRILLGTFVLSTGYYDAYYKKAMQVKALIRDAFDKAFEQYDLMLMPVALATAPKLGASLSDPLQMYLSDIYTVSVNLAGLPGISVPCGFDRNGMPIGAQLIGPALGEAKVLGAAHAYQLDTDWHQRVPKGGTAV